MSKSRVPISISRNMVLSHSILTKTPPMNPSFLAIPMNSIQSRSFFFKSKSNETIERVEEEREREMWIELRRRKFPGEFDCYCSYIEELHMKLCQTVQILKRSEELAELSKRNLPPLRVSTVLLGGLFVLDMAQRFGCFS